MVLAGCGIVFACASGFAMYLGLTYGLVGGNRTITDGQCAPRTAEQAQSFFSGLMPDSQVLAVSPAFPAGAAGHCITKVRMLVNKTDPATDGIVFLMPDGEHFLNGPMMDATSRLTPTAQAGAQQLPPTEGLSDKDKALIDMLLGVRDDVERITTEGSFPEVETPEPQEIQDALKELVSDIGKLPNQLAFNADGTNTAYVVFDPSCNKCQHFFQDMPAVAERFDTRLVWIPTYLADTTRTHAAYATKAINQEPEDKAWAILKLMMTAPGVDESTLGALLGSVSDEDFSQLEQSAAYTRVVMQAEELGTPFILFQPADGSAITFKSGYTDIEDLEANLK